MSTASVSRERIGRLVEFAGVGATGAVVNFAVFLSVVGVVHYSVAGALAFSAAVTWNFAGNWLITFSRPSGSVGRQYLRFIAVSLGGFAIYSVGLWLAIGVAGLGAAVGNLLAVGAGSIWNFVGAESWAFDESGGRTVPEVLNTAVHRIATLSVREWLSSIRLYAPLYGSYMWLLSRLYRPDEREIAVGAASATVATREPGEIVSVLHSLEKERHVLRQFVADLRSDDVVLDVGANVGIYSLLAADVADEVVAVEPYPPTVDRLRENAARNGGSVDVVPAAVGDADDWVSLSVDRQDVATQTPRVDESGERAVRQRRIDSLVREGAIPAPDVVKIDVEGSEPVVLDGMGDLLADCRVVFVESHGDDLAGRLERAGFDVEQIPAGGQTILRGVRR